MRRNGGFRRLRRNTKAENFLNWLWDNNHKKLWSIGLKYYARWMWN